MIHVCFPLHDKNGDYSKYVAVAIYSLLKNTTSHVTIHLLHDDTVSPETKHKFLSMVNQFGQKIIFHAIDANEFCALREIVGKFSIGTLFRLKILDVLPHTIDKIIYLDADLVIQIDIASIFNIKLGDNLIAACPDVIDGPRWICDHGLVKPSHYFNAGVMVLNLIKLRSEGITLNDIVEFFLRFPQCELADQDALNYLFQGKIKYLDRSYNKFTKFLRQSALDVDESCIYHFAGDYVNIANAKIFDRLFFTYLSMTPWGKDTLISHDFYKIVDTCVHQIALWQKVSAKLSDPLCKRVLFGAHSKLIEKIRPFIILRKSLDYLVDNNPTLQEIQVLGLNVFSPQVLLKENPDHICIIVLSNDHYSEICNQLLSFNLLENTHFFDGKLLLSQHQGGYPLYR